MYETLQILDILIFEKTSILKLFSCEGEDNIENDICNQPLLFDS